jgi:rubredoxin
MNGTLIDDENRTITCPRCEQQQPMRDFATLGMSPRYAPLLDPIYRCKQCNHLFAPRHQPQVAGAAA